MTSLDTSRAVWAWGRQPSCSAQARAAVRCSQAHWHPSTEEVEAGEAGASPRPSLATLWMPCYSQNAKAGRSWSNLSYKQDPVSKTNIYRKVLIPSPDFCFILYFGCATRALCWRDPHNPNETPSPCEGRGWDANKDTEGGTGCCLQVIQAAAELSGVRGQARQLRGRRSLSAWSWSCGPPGSLSPSLTQAESSFTTTRANSWLLSILCFVRTNISTIF